MNHPLRYRGNDPAVYETALVKLFRKYPPARPGLSITIYERGQMSGREVSTHRWLPGAKSIQAKAKQIARTVLEECERLSGRPIKGIRLDF
jgi:hypothetical protein